MTTLPTGEATFLFTDIEGSTRLLASLGPQYEALQARHFELLRQALAEHGGVEVNTEGDALFAVFPDAADALQAAAAMQRRIADEEWAVEPRVRIGVHTGVAALAGRDYVGLDVNRAARIAGAAHGGQVLVSDATRTRLADQLGDGLRLRDLGTHRLKDLDGLERLHQLVVPGLPADHPPPRTLDMTPSTLPEQLSTFVGRDAELREAARLLRAGRLVTLTGSGGTGKSRLALQLARELAADFPDGISFVPLAALREAELVLPAIATVYGVSEGEDLRSRLVDAIGSRQQLLLLDNFEHLLPAVRDVEELLARTPRLKVLVTSQSSLGIRGEHEYQVPPLGLPDLRRLPPTEELRRSEAVSLFLDRTRDVRPDLEMTEENARLVAQIVVALDGLPLAIELAAARTKLLPLAELHRRLQDRFSLLRDGRATADADDRRRTLRATIQWSYDLLDPDECALFARLGVFRGGAGVGLLAKVLEADDEMAVLDLLGSLADKSIVRRVSQDDEVRVDMFESLREFALDRLDARGETAEFRERHARVYTDWLESVCEQVIGDAGGSWLDHIEREHNNIRAALLHAIDGHDDGLALRIVAAAWRFWQMRGHIDEGRERAEAVIGATGTPDEGLRIKALEATGSLAYWQGDFAGARRHYQAWLDLERARENRPGIAEALYNLCFTYFVSREDPVMSQRLAEEALAIYRELDDRRGIALTLWALGGTELSKEVMDPALARAELEEARDIFAAGGNQRMLAWAHFTAAGVESRDGQTDLARSKLRDALEVFVELRDVSGYALVLRALARLESVAGRLEVAARLAGASAAIERVSGAQLSGFTTENWTTGFDIDRLRTDPETSAAWTAGEALEPEAAVEFALSVN